MKAEVKEKIYVYEWTDNSAKKAHITFDKHSGNWEFRKCVFVGTNLTYGIADWTFLRDLANEILRLNKEIGGE